MPSLFQINQEILDCVSYVDDETGEVLDLEKLDALMIERDQKVENIALFIKSMEYLVADIKAEKEALSKRQKSAENQMTRLKAYLTECLGGQKFSTAKCAISFRPSESIEIQDESLIPKKFLVKKVTFTPDKTAIKTAIKNGLKVKGCQLISKINPQIK